MKILLFGKNGQVGWELNRSLLPLGTVVALGRNEADFSDPESLRKIVREIQPDVIVNAVAYTAVDKAEVEEDLANRINGEAPGVLAEEASRIKALLIHYSTDYVFDGSRSGVYKESDVPNPVNVYGHSKLMGEKAIQAAESDYLILRVAWVYSTRGSNFLLTMLRLLREREKLSVVNDQFGAPTWARLIAETSAQILARTFLDRSVGKFNSSVCHMTSAGVASWYEFANEIREYAHRYAGSGALCEIEPIKAADYPTRALRPANTRLSIDMLQSRYALFMPDWKSALALCMDDGLSSQLRNE